MSVVSYLNLPVHAISEFQDTLANSGFCLQNSWNLEIRLYRANPTSFGAEAKQSSLFTVNESTSQPNFYVFGPKTSSIFTPEMKSLIDTKLQSLWQLRQTFKGEGFVYAKDGQLIKFANINIQGGYKGLLIDADSSCESVVQQLKDTNNLKSESVEISEQDAATPTRVHAYSVVYR